MPYTITIIKDNRKVAVPAPTVIDLNEQLRTFRNTNVEVTKIKSTRKRKLVF